MRVPALLGAKCWVCSYTMAVVGAEEAFPSPFLALPLCCCSPWCWFCCLGLCCELGHRKDPRQKRGEGEKRGFFVVLFSSGAVCSLRIVLTQPRVVNRGVEVEATYTSFLVHAEVQCNCTHGLKELAFTQGQKLCKQTMASVVSCKM